MTRTIIARPIPFGWCLDGNHDSCRVSYLSSNGQTRACVCDCHETVALPA